LILERRKQISNFLNDPYDVFAKKTKPAIL